MTPAILALLYAVRNNPRRCGSGAIKSRLFRVR